MCPTFDLIIPPDLCTPDYNVYKYRSDYYKVVRFRSTQPRLGPLVHSSKGDYIHDGKLEASISRARKVVFELALCNEWKWFASFTIAKDKFDRFDFKKYYSAFKEFIKHRSSVLGVPIPYLLVPELHKDGAWHMHGFFTSAIDSLLVPFQELLAAGQNVPVILALDGYYNMPVYQKRFGFCSFGLIQDKIAVSHYVIKYISKSFGSNAAKVGANLYYCSHGLMRSQSLGGVYGSCPDLDAVLVNHYEFCSTGFWRLERQPGDDPVMDIIEVNHLQMAPMDWREFMHQSQDFVIPDDNVCSDSFYQACIEGMEFAGR